MRKRKEQDVSSGELFEKKKTESPEHESEKAKGKVKHPNPASTIPKESTPEKQYGGLTVHELSDKFALIARRHSAKHIVGSWNGTDTINLETDDFEKVVGLLLDMSKMQKKRRFNSTMKIVCMSNKDSITNSVSIALPGKLIEGVLAYERKKKG